MIELTETELLQLKDTLERVVDEFETLMDLGNIINSGAYEGAQESLEIINPIADSLLVKQLDDFEDIDID